MDVYYPEGYGYFEHILPKEYLEEYITLSREFAIASRFWEFFESQKSNYQKWEKQFSEAMARDYPLEQLDDFYQTSYGKTVYFSISTMGTSLRVNLFLEEFNPRHGHYAPITIPFDHQYVVQEIEEPNFKYHQMALTNSVWHEVGHLYWEDINSDYRQAISQMAYEDQFPKKFNTFQDKSLDQYYFIHELIADGVAIFLKKQFISHKLAEEHLAIYESYGRPWYRKLMRLMETDYWPNREKVNFQEFIPQIIKMIEEL